MSFVVAQPELLAAAAGDLRGIGSGLQAQYAAVSGPTTAVLPPASDAVSLLTTARFNSHGTLFQTMASQAAAVHQMFVATLSGNATSYAVAEAANAAAAG
ncbi:PE family protein [Mycobacterium sp. M1]|uniref:PE family protein n=1 Tax=Mycolicibacter acidiphilus TaxID=2835306 RepID=A0ABS5RHY9_9MYCO|nr:PE family protein [Mycolicibacter acidiphilus]MBS9533214.1 PE family protein [Mycolicibacter acidiphilus]